MHTFCFLIIYFIRTYSFWFQKCISDSIYQKGLLEIEEKKLAMQKDHLDTEKRNIKLFEQYVNLRKKSYEDSKQRDKRGFFG